LGAGNLRAQVPGVFVYSAFGVNELSWNWIALGAIAPPVVALLVAFPFWWKEQPIFGNIAGTAVLFGAAFALIMREHMQLERIVSACLDGGLPCFPEPPAFTRFAIYAFVALAQVIALFTLSLKVEHRRRRRGYSPEWR
jgi:hypothetical protein